MNGKEKRQYEEMFHPWSDYIWSVDLKTIPEKIRKKVVSEKDYREFSQAFYCKLKDGSILINEAAENWQIRKDFFVALDKLPHTLLVDIYEMERKRYGDNKPSFNGITESGEKIRRLLYYVHIPELIKAHEQSKKKHI